jgi:hypothetical protein
MIIFIHGKSWTYWAPNFYQWIARKSNRFIVCREAEHRQNKVLHAVIKMVETVVS